MKHVEPVISVSFSYSRHTSDEVHSMIAPAETSSWWSRLLAKSPIRFIAVDDPISMQPAQTVVPAPKSK